MNPETPSTPLRRNDEFLSAEDLDLANLDQQELISWWNLWLRHAQVTNSEDADHYSHGVFRREPIFPSN